MELMFIEINEETVVGVFIMLLAAVISLVWLIQKAIAGFKWIRNTLRN